MHTLPLCQQQTRQTVYNSSLLTMVCQIRFKQLIIRCIFIKCAKVLVTHHFTSVGWICSLGSLLKVTSALLIVLKMQFKRWDELNISLFFPHSPCGQHLTGSTAPLDISAESTAINSHSLMSLTHSSGCQPTLPDLGNVQGNCIWGLIYWHTLAFILSIRNWKKFC